MSFNPRPGASSTPTSDSDDMALDDIEDGIGISTGSGVVLDYNEHPSLDPAIRSHLARTNSEPSLSSSNTIPRGLTLQRRQPSYIG